MNILMAGITSLFLSQTPANVPVSLPVMGEETYSLTNRYGNTFVNDVFSDNILLTLAYMSGNVHEGRVNWDLVRSDFTYVLTLKPGETFAFHDRVLPEYEGKIAMTTNAHFNSDEGFRSDHYLVGDGVCHLASFMKVVADEAGLLVVAPTRHDFAKIPDVVREDGVAIYYDPNAVGSSRLQNLYITNTHSESVQFVFHHAADTLDISIEKVADPATLLSRVSPLG